MASRMVSLNLSGILFSWDHQPPPPGRLGAVLFGGWEEGAFICSIQTLCLTILGILQGRLNCQYVPTWPAGCFRARQGHKHGHRNRPSQGPSCGDGPRYYPGRKKFPVQERRWKAGPRFWFLAKKSAKVQACHCLSMQSFARAVEIMLPRCPILWTWLKATKHLRVNAKWPGRQWLAVTSELGHKSQTRFRNPMGFLADPHESPHLQASSGKQTDFYIMFGNHCDPSSFLTHSWCLGSTITPFRITR